MVEHAHAHQARVNVEGWSRPQQSDIGWNVHLAKHSNQQRCFVLTVAVMTFKNIFGLMRHQRGLAKFDAGVTDLFVQTGQRHRDLFLSRICGGGFFYKMFEAP